MQRTTTTERADAAPSPMLALATWLIAQGLAVLVERQPDAAAKAKQLLAMAAPRVDAAALQRLGFARPRYTEAPLDRGTGLPLIKNEFTKKVSQNPSVPDEELKVVKAALVWVQNPFKEGALDRIQKTSAAISGKLYRNVERIVDAAVSTAKPTAGAGQPVIKRAAGVDKLIADFAALAKQIDPSNTDGNVAPADVKAFGEASATQLATAKEYNRLKRMIGERYMLDLAKYCSSQGGPTLVHTVFAHMTGLGYPFSKVVAAKREIPLRVDVQSGKIRYYTSDGDLLLGAIPANINKIGFPKTYDPETKQGAYMVIKAPTAVGITRVYTEAHKATAQRDKFNKADAINENITTYLTKWVRDLNHRDPFVQMAAAICYIIYQTGARIGSRQFSAASNSGEQTYGIISLRPRHVRVNQNTIVFEYNGKKGGLQKHVIRTTDPVGRRLAQLLTQLKADKKKDDLLFSVRAPNGKWQHIIPKRVGDYLKAMGYEGGVHKMRHVRGTNLVIELLAKSPWKPAADAKTLQARQKLAEEYMKTKVLEPVGKLLGHFAGDKVTWRTSIANYINPNVVAAWFTGNGLKVPSWVPKTISGDED